MFWKVTGRLQVSNLPRLVASTPLDCWLYIDFRRYRRPWVDTRIFASTPGAFRRLFLTRINLLRQDILPAGVAAPEELLFSALLPERERERIVPRLRLEPVIEGFSGSRRPTATRALARSLMFPHRVFEHHWAW